ncbi:MAG TPA: hypothetical protein DEV87_01355 [Clostridiales bacterium]|nr:hypothetical protein [Clostridiales bacterium]
MYSQNIDNLFFAGRNVSMTHMAMSSARGYGYVRFYRTGGRGGGVYRA